MVTTRVLAPNATRVAAGLRASGVAAQAAVKPVVVHYGTLLQTRVKANASGRPGPRAPSGDYRRGIGLEFDFSGLTSRATVGTNAPQGRRLEWGFHGTDSLGRTYAQPPYPHFGPAVDALGGPFELAVSEAVGAAV